MAPSKRRSFSRLTGCCSCRHGVNIFITVSSSSNRRMQDQTITLGQAGHWRPVSVWPNFAWSVKLHRSSSSFPSVSLSVICLLFICVSDAIRTGRPTVRRAIRTHAVHGARKSPLVAVTGATTTHPTAAIDGSVMGSTAVDEKITTNPFRRGCLQLVLSHISAFLAKYGVRGTSFDVLIFSKTD